MRQANERERKRRRESRPKSIIAAAFRVGDLRHHGDAAEFVIKGNGGEVTRFHSLMQLVSVRSGLRAADSLARLVEAAPLELPVEDSRRLVEQARLNQRARQAFVNEFPVLNATQVHEIIGSTAKNVHASATRLRREGRIFGVKVDDEYRYPVFQFDEYGAVKAGMRKLLGAAGDLREWGLALWLAAPNGYLAGARPVDLLGAEPDSVIEAVRREVADVI